MTEINWSFTITHKRAVLATGALSTIDPSFPIHLMEQLGAEHAPCTIQVHNSVGELYEKDWE